MNLVSRLGCEKNSSVKWQKMAFNLYVNSHKSYSVNLIFFVHSSRSFRSAGSVFSPHSSHGPFRRALTEIGETLLREGILLLL